MKNVRVNKIELLEIVKKNREQHKEIFDEAVIGYRKQLLEYLESMVVDVKLGKKINHHINLQYPVDETKEYDRVVKMLEMSQDEIIELDSVSFANFVMDEWSWTDMFTNTNACYSQKALSKLKP